ncbi:MAG: DUF4920 domain-containing protein [Deltaproteobacteria bacterium]|nr:DUF4920 domain-containing protein [Deltaproteobacteria bacterium]
MIHARLVLLAILALVAWGAAQADSGKSVPAGKDFGAGITLAQPTALANVLGETDRYRTEPVLLHGRISEVCQHKGCWTILQDGKASVRVRFVDYGFFLPKDCSGEEAFIQGTVKVETLSEDQARHYEAETRDGDPERIQGPQREVGFLASGVRLVGRQDVSSE